MWSIITLLAGILLIVGTILAFVFGECKTPSHLRGYYGKSYGWRSLFGIIGGIALIVISFIL